MADPPRSHDTGGEPARDSPSRMPRWVKVMGIVVIVLVLVFLGLKLFGIGGQHGPGRHTSDDPGGQTSLSTVTAKLILSGGGGYAPQAGGC